MQLPFKIYWKILGGNFLLVVSLFAVQYILDHCISFINVSVASSIFFTITFISLQRTIADHKNKRDVNIIFLSQGVGLIRIGVSLVWMFTLKEIEEGFSSWQVLEFISIYIYYLIIDVLYLDKIFRYKQTYK